MPNPIRNGRYGKTNGKPRGTRRPRIRPATPRRPRGRVASADAEVVADELTSSVTDLIPSRLRRLGECAAEWWQQRAQRFAGDQPRDHGVGPDGLVGIGDQ